MIHELESSVSRIWYWQGKVFGDGSTFFSFCSWIKNSLRVPAPYVRVMWDILNEGLLSLSCMVEVSPGTDPKVTPLQDGREGRHTRTRAWPLTSLLLIQSLCVFIFLCACVFTYMCLCVLGQDMGQEIEPYFQEVLAALEQSVEEGGKGEGGALWSRLQRLYNEIVTDTDSGRSSLTRKCSKAEQVSLRHSCSVCQLIGIA